MNYRHDLLAYWSSEMVRDIRPQHHKLLRCQSASILKNGHPRTERRTLPFSSSAFSAASSSISVVSVPFDVTGDGPTISLLGLMRCAELGLIKEFGRRDWDSGPDEDLGHQATVRFLPLRGGALRMQRTPCTVNEQPENRTRRKVAYLRACSILRRCFPLMILGVPQEPSRPIRSGHTGRAGIYSRDPRALCASSSNKLSGEILDGGGGREL